MPTVVHLSANTGQWHFLGDGAPSIASTPFSPHLRVRVITSFPPPISHPPHIDRVLFLPTCRHTLQALVYHTLAPLQPLVYQILPPLQALVYHTLHSKHWFTTPFLHSKHWFTTPSTPSTGLPHPPLQALVYHTLHSKHWFTTPSTPSTCLPHPPPQALVCHTLPPQVCVECLECQSRKAKFGVFCSCCCSS